MEKRELTDEEKRQTEEYSEGNKYLQEALITCWENGIRTYACCGGHRDKSSEPYLGILIDDTSIDAIKRIIGSLQDMEDIEMSTSIRGSGKGDTFQNSECRTIIIRGFNCNRCELFYRISNAIKSKEDIELSKKGEELFNSVKKLNDIEYSEIVKDNSDGIVMGSLLKNNSNDLNYLIEYRFNNRWVDKIKRVPVIRKILEKFSKKTKEDNYKYDKVKSKYEFFQESYIPEEKSLRESLKQPIEEEHKNSVKDAGSQILENNDSNEERGDK